MARLLGHRQTKGAATDKPILPPPRHIPTLPIPGVDRIGQHAVATVHLLSEGISLQSTYFLAWLTPWFREAQNLACSAIARSLVLTLPSIK
jgi:hypothetical protein